MCTYRREAGSTPAKAATAVRTIYVSEAEAVFLERAKHCGSKDR